MNAGPVQIALLRGVMPTGKNRVPMAELRAVLEALGFAGARTLIASGNAVFRTHGPTGAELEAMLERAIAERIGPELDVMVRDQAQWEAMVAAAPFAEERETQPSKVSAVVLKRTPTAEGARAFEGAAVLEKAQVIGDVAWLVFTDAAALGKALAPAAMKRTLGCSGTARNWNTVVRLQALAAEVAGA